MSIEALTWAFNLEHRKPTQKAVLIALANHSNPDGGSCHPSVKRIMLYTGLSNTAVANALKGLEAAGLITAFRQMGKRTNYSLHLDHKAVNEVHQLTRLTSERGSPQAVNEAHDTSERGSRKPSVTINEPSIYDQFDEFWSAYPRKVGKRKATAEWTRAVKRSPPGEIIAGCHRHAIAWASTDPQFIPHPTTWLTRDGWNDEPPTPQNKGHGSAVEAGLRLMEASE